MAGPEQSHLSIRQDGYDFVVSTTQGSLNSGLKEFLDKVDQPTTEICLIIGSDGTIREAITLDELKERSSGVDPFTIPHDTDWKDDKIQALFNARFVVGIRFQLGLPSTALPKDLPDVIELGRDARNIKFRLMSKEFVIVVNNPLNGWVDGSWEVLKQSDRVKGKSQMWLFETTATLHALENLSGTAFSLQQLMSNLDSMVVQNIPEIKGIAKETLAYQALDSDPSNLVMTAYERQVTSHNNPLASTLDNVCMTNNHLLPAAYAFEWNWVTEDQVDEIHSVLALNQTVLTNIFTEQLLRLIPDFCCAFNGAWTRSHPPVYLGVTFYPGQDPEIQMVSTGDTTLAMTYKFYTEEVQETRSFQAKGFKASEEYTCSLSMEQNSIKVEHTIKIQLGGSRESYGLAVDAGGTLLLSRNKLSVCKNDKLDARAFEKYKLGVTVRDIHDFADMIEDAFIEDRPFNQLQNFVFPGSKIFTFTNARISDYQDMVYDLQYLPPTGSNSKSTLEDATGLRITHSSELMENYLHTENQSPTGHFEALQTDNENSHALVFAIGSDGDFYAWQECSGETTTGWKRHDLSLSTLRRHFAPGDDATVRTFGVGQSPLDGSIGMAMGVDSGGVDNLYISLGNSSSNVSWIKRPTWISVPFDSMSDRKDFRIVKIMFSETAYNIQYLMVDINTGISGHQIVRYHIDLEKSKGKAWVKHDLAIDLKPGTYYSIVSHKLKERVDSVYTAGSIAGAPQLVYEPIINVYSDDVPPTVTRLRLPDREPPTAIATVQDMNSSSNLYEATDLYMIAGEVMLKEDIFSGTDSLHTIEFDNIEVFYVSCYINKITDPALWSYPIPLLSDAVRISPYINRVNGGNTIFTYTTNTKTKTWKIYSIQIKPVSKPEPEPVKSFLLYLTTVTLLDTNNQPAIKNTYRSILSIYIPQDSETTTINPMDKAFSRVSDLDTTDRIRRTTYPVNIVAGGMLDKDKEPLINPETSQKNINSAAEIIKDIFRYLKKAAKKVIEVIKDAATNAWKFITNIAGKVYNAVLDTVDAIIGAVIWIFNAIKTAIEAIIHFIKDWAESPPDNSSQDPTRDYNMSSLLFINHFRGQADKIQVKSALPELITHTKADKLIKVLLDTISDKGKVLSGVYKDLQELATSFKSLSIKDIIKRITAILESTLISSVKVVADTLFHVLSVLTSSALDLLDTKLYIPIISNILNTIGIPGISFLDLFCWIGAVEYTVMYKIISSEAPFPDTSNIRDIITADSWDKLNTKIVYRLGHGISSLFLSTTTFAKSAEALYLTGSNPWSKPASVIAARLAVSTAITVIVIGRSLLFSGSIQEKHAAPSSKFKGLALNNRQASNSIIQSVLVMPALFVTASQERSAAIISEVTEIAKYTATVSYTVAVNLKHPELKVFPVTVMAAANVTGAGLQTARAAFLN
ncbi:hypothetical protein BDV23DRAFT_168392 [Aspergillus alliaceus]|uniref:Uncharacterized protein n=1 Tax=Petromyces alliaceus TaxID=209559 RepID=A0A5N7CPC8_PETAA|nr:hypothetical protein BDV23DRAFT_168392 [Aspergillus alliaceus]